MSVEFLTIAVAGVQHRNGDDLRRVCVRGVLAELRREPSNPHDSNAIQVVVNSVVIGYVPATIAAWMSKLCDAGWLLWGRIKACDPWDDEGPHGPITVGIHAPRPENLLTSGKR